MTLLHALACGMIAAAGGPVDAPPVAPPPRASPPKVVARRLTSYRGFVVAVDAQSITVLGAEPGPPQPEVVRRFVAGAALLAGEQNPDERSIADYRLSDVRVGDRVFLTLRPGDVPDVCAAVGIERRPGGVVPPAPWDRPDNPTPVHERMNAWQAFEEKGTPLPPKYDPVFQRQKFEADQRRQAVEEAVYLWRRDHTAPPPRAARPRK